MGAGSSSWGDCSHPASFKDGLTILGVDGTSYWGEGGLLLQPDQEKFLHTAGCMWGAAVAGLTQQDGCGVVCDVLFLTVVGVYYSWRVDFCLERPGNLILLPTVQHSERACLWQWDPPLPPV